MLCLELGRVLFPGLTSWIFALAVGDLAHCQEASGFLEQRRVGAETLP